MGKQKEYEKIRAEVSKRYKGEIEELKAQVNELRKENFDLKVQLSESEGKVVDYEEWIERMQEYCNFSEEEMQVLKEKLQTRSRIEDIMKGMSPLFSSLVRQYL